MRAPTQAELVWRGELQHTRQELIDFAWVLQALPHRWLQHEHTQ
jgi:hypothetical protein